MKPSNRPFHFQVTKLLLALAILAGFAPASDDFVPRRLVEEGTEDVPQVAYALTQTFLTEEQWQEEVSQFRGRFEEWQQETGGNVNRFLNDRLLIHGLSAAGGKIEKIKKGLIWLAMYREFDATPPGVVTKFIRENRASVTALFTDFSWEKVSQYIRNKQWRKDAEERKKIAAAQK